MTRDDSSPLQGESMRGHGAPQVTERYLLGELGEDESLAFEAHCLECEACASDLLSASRFIAGARMAAAEGAPRAEVAGTPVWDRLRGWWQAPGRLVPALALVALLAPPLAYQSLVALPRLERELALRDQPRAIEPLTLRRPTRGEGRIIAFATNQPSLVVAIEPPAHAGDGALVVELRGPDQQIVIPAFSLPASPPGEPLLLQLPTKSLRTGAHELFIKREGLAAGPLELARFPLNLERR